MSPTTPRPPRAGKASVVGLVLASNLLVLGIVAAVLYVVWPRGEQKERQPVAATPVPATPPVIPAEKPEFTPPPNSRPAPPEWQKPQQPSAGDEAAPATLPDKPAANLSVADIANRVEKSVVLIDTYDAKGEQLGFGTGFLVDEAGRIATNYHVLNGCSKAKITYHDKQTIETTSLRAWDDRSDLALLEPGASAPKPAPLTLAPGLPDRANEVIAIGHPRGLQFTTTTGIVSAVYRTDELPPQFRQFLSAPNDQRWIQTTAVIIGGSSGGPLLNARGEVVGINTWSINEAKLGFAVQADPLRTLLAQPRETPADMTVITAPQTETQRLIDEYNNRYQWFSQEAGKLRSKASLDKLIAEKHPAPEFVRKLGELAAKYPDSPSVYWIWQTVCQIALQPGAPESCRAEMKTAAGRLVDRYVDDSRLRTLVWELRASSVQEAWDMLRSVSDKCADKDTKGLACLSLAVALQGSNSDGKYTDDAIAQLKRIIAECRDVPFGGKTLGDYAEDQLYLVENLSIGRKAPEIVGKDVDGNEFKLSDHAGKVVVLDFWADWCPHCVAMYPLERRLVKLHANEPFALLGINTDEPNRLRELIDKETVTWKNWSDGQQGPIVETYRVESFPTLYVLDHEGKIRYRDVRGEQLSKAVKELLEKVPGRADSSKTKPTTDETAPPADALRPEGTP